jgi:hypothetical protein
MGLCRLNPGTAPTAGLAEAILASWHSRIVALGKQL